MSARTTQLLTSGEFFKLRYDTIPVKSASGKVPFYTVTKKCQILSCDNLVANELYVYIGLLVKYPSLFSDFNQT